MKRIAAAQSAVRVCTRSLDVIAAEQLPWIEPTEGDLMALAVHHQLASVGSEHTATLDLELDKRLESLLTREAAIAATGGRRNELATRRAQHLVHQAVADFLQPRQPARDFSTAVSA